MIDEVAILRAQIATLEGERDPVARAALARKRKQLARPIRLVRITTKAETGGNIPQAKRPATARQMEILCWIAEHPRCSIAEVAKAMGVTSTKCIGAACKAQQVKGLLTWQPRAVRSMRPTDKGISLIGAAAKPAPRPATTTKQSWHDRGDRV